MNKGVFELREESTHQDDSLSLLLSNIMLNELDKELAQRGHRFVRFADDVMIFCRSMRGQNVWVNQSSDLLRPHSISV